MNAKVLLVDDHPMLLSGLCQELAKHAGLEIVGRTSNGPQAVKLASEVAPDLVVMDVHLCKSDGIAATRDLLNIVPSVKVVVFSADSDQLQVDEALRAGASAYVLKSSAVDELIHAMDMVMQGRMYVSPDLSSDILQNYRDTLTRDDLSAKPVLSDNEKELLRLLTAGKRSKEIATHLNLSLSSVETYRMRLRRKLGCESTAELVRYAIANKIVEL